MGKVRVDYRYTVRTTQSTKQAMVDKPFGNMLGGNWQNTLDNVREFWLYMYYETGNQVLVIKLYELKLKCSSISKCIAKYLFVEKDMNHIIRW